MNAHCIGIAHAITPAAPPPITTKGAGTFKISVHANDAMPMQIVVVGNGLDAVSYTHLTLPTTPYV